MIKVNGEKVNTEKEVSLEEFLVNHGYLLERIVVEINGEIAPRQQYKQINIKDGDSLEVISFVGGG